LAETMSSPVLRRFRYVPSPACRSKAKFSTVKPDVAFAGRPQR